MRDGDHRGEVKARSFGEYHAQELGRNSADRAGRSVAVGKEQRRDLLSDPDSVACHLQRDIQRCNIAIHEFCRTVAVSMLVSTFIESPI